MFSGQTLSALPHAVVARLRHIRHQTSDITQDFAMHLSIPLAHLTPHPLNSNVMPAKLFDKLVANLGRTRRYPPVIVRPLPDDEATASQGRRYQILDGHHRVKALAQLGVAEARCVVWEVS